MAKIRTSLSIEILNQATDNVLYIKDSGSQGNTLEITLSDAEGIALNHASGSNYNGTPGLDNYSFYLYFQPSTLFASNLLISISDDGSQPKAVSTTSDWRANPVANSDGSVSIYFLKTAAQTLGNGDKGIAITLANVIAVSGESRTANVELHVMDDQSVDYLSQTYLNIVNHAGQQELPVTITAEIGADTSYPVVSGGQILNDGSVNDLVLKLHNTGSEDLEFDSSKIVVRWSATSDTLDNLYALTTHDEAPEDISIFGEQVNLDDPEAINPSYTLSNFSGSIALDDTNGENYLIVELANFKTSLPTGTANLYIDYYNVPGYWDGTLTVRLRRTSMIMSRINYQGILKDRIGIGTTTPGAKLELTDKINTSLQFHTWGTGPQLVFQALQGGSKDLTVNFLAHNSTTEQELIRIKGSNYTGRVGIGNSSPGALLEIGSTGTSTNTKINLIVNGRIQSNGAGGMWVGDGQNLFVGANEDSIGLYNNKEWRLLVDKTGQVGIGIGINTPAAKLQVGGGHIQIDDSKTITMNSKDTFTYNSKSIPHYSLGWYADSSWNKYGPTAWMSGYGGIKFFTGGAFRMALNQAGSLGIGTDSPTKGKVEIKGNVGYGLTTNNYYSFLRHVAGGDPSSSIAFNYHANQTADYSLYASDRIAASEFNAMSDVRIKNVRGISDGSLDLQTLMRIEVTDYNMKDWIAKGQTVYKKFIGQQVAKVYPQAVTNSTTEIVPDIYEVAKVDDGWVLLPGKLQIGEKVKLIIENQGEEVYEVLQVNGRGFRTNLPKEVSAVFVYGREVDDFHTVDYDAISALNLSATQELCRQVWQLQEENERLKYRLTHIEEIFEGSMD